jgi:hypothetical protein
MEKLGKTLADYKIQPHNLYNMDETSVKLSDQHVKVISKQGAPRPRKISDKFGEHLTLVLCVPASGTYVKPLLILALKTLPRLDPITETFFYISGQANGSITKQIFFNWTVDIFLPHIAEMRKLYNEPDEWILLLVDGHNSRDFMPSIIEFNAHKVLVLVLPAHSSTVLQPLDLQVNYQFKRVLTDHFSIKKGEPKEEQRIRLLNMSVQALQVALSPLYIKSGFSKAGIWPFSKDAPLKSSLVRDPEEAVVQSAAPKRHAAVRISGMILNNRVNETTPLPLLPPPPTPTPLKNTPAPAPALLLPNTTAVVSPIITIKKK